MNTETLKLIIDLVSKLGGDAKLVLFTWLAIDIAKYLIIAGSIALVIRWIIKCTERMGGAEQFRDTVMSAAGFSGTPVPRELNKILDYLKAGRAKDCLL